MTGAVAPDARLAIAFLEALTDAAVLRNPAFGNPWLITGAHIQPPREPLEGQ